MYKYSFISITYMTVHATIYLTLDMRVIMNLLPLRPLWHMLIFIFLSLPHMFLHVSLWVSMSTQWCITCLHTFSYLLDQTCTLICCLLTSPLLSLLLLLLSNSSCCSSSSSSHWGLLFLLLLRLLLILLSSTGPCQSPNTLKAPVWTYNCSMVQSAIWIVIAQVLTVPCS